MYKTVSKTSLSVHSPIQLIAYKRICPRSTLVSAQTLFVTSSSILWYWCGQHWRAICHLCSLNMDWTCHHYVGQSPENTKIQLCEMTTRFGHFINAKHNIHVIKVLSRGIHAQIFLISGARIFLTGGRNVSPKRCVDRVRQTVWPYLTIREIHAVPRCIVCFPIWCTSNVFCLLQHLPEHIRKLYLCIDPFR